MSLYDDPDYVELPPLTKKERVLMILLWSPLIIASMVILIPLIALAGILELNRRVFG